MRKIVFTPTGNFLFATAITLLATALLSLRVATNSNLPVNQPPVDVEHYTVHLSVLDFNTRIIHGKTVIKLKSMENGVTSLNLSLRQLTTDSVVQYSGTPLSFTHIGDDLAVMLPTALNQGDTFSVIVYYHGIPFNESWGGFHFSGQYAFNLGVGFVSYPPSLGKAWFPCIDDFRDRATFDYYICVNTEQKAVCGGLLQSVTPHGNGTQTFHWKMTKSIPTYLASVAVGQYEKWENTFNGLQGPVPIQIFVRPADLWKVPGSFANLNTILGIFETHFGPYPFERVGYVGTALGAMEHAGNIAYPNSIIDNTASYEWLYTHELAHMWFGDKVTCDGPTQMWLNEGWAVWTEIFYREMLYGYEPSRVALRSKQKEVLQFAHTPSGDGSYLALNNIPPAATYGTTVYQKGGMVVHTLQHYLGNEIFFPAIRAYLDTFAFRHAHTNDLCNFLSAHTGFDMNGFFDNWVNQPGFPHYSVDSVHISSTGTWVFVRQRAKGRTFIGNSNIVEISFLDANLTVWSDTMLFHGVTGAKWFTPPFQPQLVMLDFFEKTCDAVTDFRQKIVSAGMKEFPHTFSKTEVLAVSDTTLIRIRHHWVPPDPLKTPMPGITLSPYRYWQVEGNPGGGFHAKGHFQYSRSGYLDNTLIQNQQDSLLILWRPSTAGDWRRVRFTKLGPWSIGWLIVDTLRTGEYTLALKSNQTGEVPNFQSGSTRIYPNPASSLVMLEWDHPAIKAINIYDANGKQIDTVFPIPGSNKSGFDTSALKPGIYLLRLINDFNNTSETIKLVVNKNMY